MELFQSALQVVVSSASILGILLNLSLMPLIILKSGSAIGSYKVLLFCYSLVAMTNSVCSWLTVPIFEPVPSGWAFYATANRMPKMQGSYVICLYSATYINLVLTLTYSFLYRYFAMCKESKLHWFKEPTKILILIFLFFSIYFCCAIPLFAYTYRNPLVLSSTVFSVGIFNISLEETAFIAVPTSVGGVLQWKTVALILLWCTVMCTAFSISAFCSFKILKIFRDSGEYSQFSSKIRSLHVKLFVLLTYQTALPLLLEFLPIMGSYVMAFLGLYYPHFSAICSALLCIAKVLDPILIVLMITDYRKALFQLTVDEKWGNVPAVTVAQYLPEMVELISSFRDKSHYCCGRFQILTGGYMVAITYCAIIFSNLAMHVYKWSEAKWSWQIFFTACDTVSVACLFFGLYRRRPAFLQPFTVVSITTVSFCILLTLNYAIAALQRGSYYREQIEILLANNIQNIGEIIRVNDKQKVLVIVAAVLSVTWCIQVIIHIWFMIIVVHCAQWLRNPEDDKCESLMLEEKEPSVSCSASDADIEKGTSYL